MSFDDPHHMIAVNPSRQELDQPESSDLDGIHLTYGDWKPTMTPEEFGAALGGVIRGTVTPKEDGYVWRCDECGESHFEDLENHAAVALYAHRRAKHVSKSLLIEMQDVPDTSEDRILWNPGREEIDEIVCHNVTIHIEKLTNECWWMGVTSADGQCQLAVNFVARKKGTMTVTLEEDGGTWPWAQDEEHTSE